MARGGGPGCDGTEEEAAGLSPGLPRSLEDHGRGERI